MLLPLLIIGSCDRNILCIVRCKIDMYFAKSPFNCRTQFSSLLCRNHFANNIPFLAQKLYHCHGILFSLGVLVWKKECKPQLRYVDIQWNANHFLVMQCYLNSFSASIKQNQQLRQHFLKLTFAVDTACFIYCSIRNLILPCMPASTLPPNGTQGMTGDLRCRHSIFLTVPF